MSNSTGNKIGLPIYEALADRIRQSIRVGEYSSGQMIGSEYELARRESISRMTVRRASELLVNEGLVERRPGKGLYVRSDRVNTRMVQMVAGNLQWEPSLQVSRGAQTVAKQRGIQVQLYDAHGDVELDLAMLRQLPTSQARGAIVVSLHSPTFNEAVYQLKVEKFPFVLVDQRLQDIEVSSVTADDHSGGYQVGQVFTQAGHKRIAFIGDLDATTVRDRQAGLRDAIADAGQRFDRSLVLDLQAGMDRMGDWSARIDVCVRDVMGRPNPPTAIFFSCDAVARTAYRTLLQMGLRIPQDVSVMGYDDDPLAEWLTPGLTTVRQPFLGMGQAAMEMLCRRMGNSHLPVEHQVLPVELVNRGSVAAL